MPKILIIEDDTNLKNELSYLLEQNGYEVISIDNFDNVLKQIEELSFDLIILDINIPGINGKHILKEFRKTNNTPVIMVTSSTADIDEIMSMNYGADDYITKPYNPEILLLRIENILRRYNTVSDVINYKHLKINLSKSIIESDLEEIVLSKNELNIFLCLYKNKGNITSRDDLISYLWSSDEFIDDNTLTVNINRLRNKLESVGIAEALETRRGQGYILK